MATTKNKLTIQELVKRGYPVVPGRKAIPKSLIPKKPLSLEEVHRRFAKVKGDIAVDEIRRLREES